MHLFIEIYIYRVYIYIYVCVSYIYICIIYIYIYIYIIYIYMYHIYISAVRCGGIRAVIHSSSAQFHARFSMMVSTMQGTSNSQQGA